MRTGHGIADHNHRARLSGGLQRSEPGKRDFSAGAALAVAVKYARSCAIDGGTVLQCLRSLRACHRGKRRALNNFSAMQAFKAQQLDALAKWSPWSASPWAFSMVFHAGGGRRSCALNIPAPSNNPPPTSEQAQMLRFILSSPPPFRASKLHTYRNKPPPLP